MESFSESTEWISAHIEQAAQVNEPQLLQVGETVIDRQTGRISSAQGERWLRGKELDLLAYLYAHVGVTFTRPELLKSVWNCCPNLLTRTVDQTVATLRKKIEMEPEQPRLLQTVYGIGYRLTCGNFSRGPRGGFAD
jgi:DNA-binding response OmpR family regulator